MLIIANNITTREPQIASLFQQLKPDWHSEDRPAKALRELVHKCLAAGAQCFEINLQQHHDRPAVMEAAVRIVQELADCQLCLSSNNPETLEAGLKACRRFPIVNYVSAEEPRLRETLPMIARYGAGVVLLASHPSRPTDAEEMLGKAAVLVGAARESGIPYDHILVDPGLIHITADIGQRHLKEVMEFLRTFPETFDPQVRSTCWLGNASAGAALQLRPVIETTLLAVFAGLGLSSVFLDVLSPENVRTLRLLQIINNEMVYADSVLAAPVA
ncbi:MAG: dihydropteroate synthase [Chloroflexi bacterium]|nr:dihydropteroate synthase [Chloroflexota bacterium]